MNKLINLMEKNINIYFLMCPYYSYRENKIIKRQKKLNIIKNILERENYDDYI